MRRYRNHSETCTRQVVQASEDGMTHADIAKTYTRHGSLITRWRKELNKGVLHVPTDEQQPNFPNPEREIYRVIIENTLLTNRLLKFAGRD